MQHVVLHGVSHQFGRQRFGCGLVEPEVSEKRGLGFPSRVRGAEQVAHDLVDRNRREVGIGEFHQREKNTASRIKLLFRFRCCPRTA